MGGIRGDRGRLGRRRMIGGLLVDTGFFFALRDARDQYHASAEEKKHLLDTREVILPWPVLYETLNTRFVGLPGALDWFREAGSFARHPTARRRSVPGRIPSCRGGQRLPGSPSELGRQRTPVDHRGQQRPRFGCPHLQSKGLRGRLPATPGRDALTGAVLTGVEGQVVRVIGRLGTALGCGRGRPRTRWYAGLPARKRGLHEAGVRRWTCPRTHDVDVRVPSRISLCGASARRLSLGCPG